MERYSVFVPKLLPAAEAFVAGAGSCPGCGQALAARLIGKAIGHHNRFPYGGSLQDVQTAALPSRGWKLFPGQQVRAAQAAGAAGNPVAVAGESGTFQDMLPLLQDAARRGNRFFSICFFNEAGIERHDGEAASGCRPDRTKSFLQRLEHMHAVLEAVRALQPEFMATACPGYPHDLIAKVKQGLACAGSAFLAVLAPCPTGCQYHPSLSLRACRLAVRSGFFPLYTASRAGLTMTELPQEGCAVSEYLKLHQAYIYLQQNELAQVQDRVARFLQQLRSADNR
jgi:pyruvate ferredoxin oxidoreductase beta subunit